MVTRQPIISVLGHVDTGKTTLLDTIRGSAIALREVGSMTQHIGASFFPLETLTEICGTLLTHISGEIKINGLLVVDTPGHRAFMNLRRRGGSVADMAILVLDIIRGFEAQTHESVSILRSRKTPFILAANKIDLIPGWVKHSNKSFIESFKSQDLVVQRQLDNLLYVVMGSLSRLGFKSERFDRVKDFAETVAIVPVSAKSGEGIPELLSVLIGLTQQYMQKKLKLTFGPAKGTVLEVKEELGLGATINAIIYDGILNRGDTVVIGGKDKPIVTKVRAIFIPKPLDEIRAPRDRFTPVESVSAAAGVKMSAPNIENALAGAPIYATKHYEEIGKLVKLISEEVEKLRFSTEKIGVVLKADTLGSLEALVNELENSVIPIRLADVGDVSRREVIEASIVRNESPLLGVILAFSVKVLPDAKEEARIQELQIFENNVIYRLIEDYNDWVKMEREARIHSELDALIRPGEVKTLPNCVFRRSKPAVFGVEVIMGTVRSGCLLIGINGKVLGEILQIQEKGESVPEAKTGMQVAMSLKGVTIGRDFNEGDILHVAVPENHVKKLKEYEALLSSDDIEALNNLIRIMRKKSPLWGL